MNRKDFKCRLTALVLVMVRSWGSRPFHAAGPQQLKPRSPNFVLVVHLTQSPLWEDLRCLPQLMITGCTNRSDTVVLD